MKKPNRIARKGDTARPRAQAKRRASAPAKSNAKLIHRGSVSPGPGGQSRKPSTARPLKPKPSPEAALAAAIGLEENRHGTLLCEVDRGAGVWQALYRRGNNEFTLVDSCLTVHDGRYWRSWEEWSEIHPGIAESSLPKRRLRRKEFPEKLARGEVIAWLWENFGDMAIPEDFAEDFRPLGIVPYADHAAVNESFFALAKAALKDCLHAEDRAAAAIDIRNVAMLLRLGDVAAKAATIVDGHNASVIAANALDDMIEAGLA